MNDFMSWASFPPLFGGDPDIAATLGQAIAILAFVHWWGWAMVASSTHSLTLTTMVLGGCTLAYALCIAPLNEPIVSFPTLSIPEQLTIVAFATGFGYLLHVTFRLICLLRQEKRRGV